MMHRLPEVAVRMIVSEYQAHVWGGPVRSTGQFNQDIKTKDSRL